MMYHKKRLLRQTFFAWQENSPSLLPLLADSPLWDGAFGKTAKLSALPKAPSPRELAKPLGFD